MKNKEIEEILEGIKVVIKHNGTLEFDVKELKILLSYIEQLEKENETLGEIVNIKDEQLKEIQMQKTDYTAVNILEAKIEQLEKTIYKARKMIFDNYGVLDKYQIEMLDDILKGDSDE